MLLNMKDVTEPKVQLTKSIPKILIVDDDLVSQFASRYAVEQSNIKSHIYMSDGALEALELLSGLLQNEEDFPDFILLDLVMPHMSGWEFIEDFEKINKNKFDTKIYILSAFTNSVDREKAKNHPHIAGHFDKPISKVYAKSILESFAN